MSLATPSARAQGGAFKVLQPGQVEVQDGESGIVRGIVLDEDERAVAGLTVVLRRPRAAADRTYPEPWVVESTGSDRVAKVETDDQGRFAFSGLVPSRYEVTPEREGIGGGTAHVVVDREHPAVSVTVRVAFGGVIVGRVVGVDGEPMEQTAVVLAGVDLGDGLNRVGDPRPFGERTNGAGEFTLIGVPRGLVHIQARRWDWGWARPIVLDTRATRVITDVELVLAEEPGALAGRGPAGVGVTLEFTPAGPVIRKVHDGSPGDEVGLKAFDLIVRVADRDTRFMSPGEFRSRCRGEPGTTVELEIVRPDGTRRAVTITRRTDVWGEDE